MNCYKCATPLPDHSKFCMACGADVSGEGHTHNTMSTEQDAELLAMLQQDLGSDYTVERELGRGGMAIVYLGQDNHLGRKVAIKLLPPMLTFGSGPGFINRFKREARTAATLDHPHIIPVYRVSTGGKLFWYVMKFLQGESLDIVVKRDGALPIDKTADMLLQVADALDYAHQSGVIHRDVKPANFMVDKKGWVTVTDFGIAKAVDTSMLTASGSTIGTPHYMSPEQCAGMNVTGASDQYALAVSAYQMLSGQLPFSADSLLELMRLHAMEPPPPLKNLRPELPRGVIAAVEKGLGKEPEDRFPTCTDFARALADAAKNPLAPVTIVPPRPPAPKAGVRVKVDPAMAPTKPAPAITRRSGALKYAGIAAGIVILAGIGYAALNPGKPPALPTPAAQTDTPRTAESKPQPPPIDTTTRVAQAESTATPAVTPETKAPEAAPVARKTADANTAARTKQPTNATKQAGNPVAPSTKTAATNPATSSAVPAAPATISVGSRPASAVSINGKPAPGHPVMNYEVPAGRVAIHFQVTDSMGVWSVDTTITVAPGEKRNLGRVVLKRP